MKYIQDENIFVLIGVVILSALLIWWVKSGDIKESKRLEKENLEMNSITKMRSWRVYIVAGTGIIIILFKIIKRLVNAIFF